MLAIGSVIADEYREFERRLDGSFKLVRPEKNAINNFANQSVKLTLNDNQEIDIAFPENLWVDGNINVNQVHIPDFSKKSGIFLCIIIFPCCV
ncbi:hypothetical protein [Dolichospermum compactum]|uniref:Uncharacterized protein n=1 Tax=Dolichospermum compactum NIES-806 TaxID=1973481 RepID=A0A1Z4V9D8_9CYAN|nr:hypothetical protein [Dolichospermum compactum]BAZ88186.1 hypothetical protein NIES806_44200 [Dolichospermum compactum NIES-806]